MKKKLLLLISVFLFLVTLRASAGTLFFYDAITNYANGCITTNTTAWYPHLPGSLTANDAIVQSNFYTSGAAISGKKLRINGLKSEYIMRLFDPATTNELTSGVIYYSFIANANFVPSAGAGTYFAALNNADTNNPPQFDDNGFDFRGRVFEIGNTNVFPFTNTTAGTFQYGIANAAGDPAQGGSAFIKYPAATFDLIKNIDYQVVVKYIIDDGIPADAATAVMWINPASESDTANMAGPTTDSGAVANGLAGLLFRQRTGGGTVDIRDIAVGTNFTDVVTNLPGPVLIATNYQTVTNYAGNPALVEVFPTSIGGGVLTYQWYRIDGAGITNAVAGGTKQTLYIGSLGALDQGNYFCAITNSGGIGNLSRTNFYISVNATPTAAGFTIQPTNTSVSVGGTLTMTCSAFGSGPLSFQWFLNGNALVDGQPGSGNAGDISVVSGSQTPTLTVSLVSTNEAGNYTVTVTGSVPPPATSSNAAVVVKLPQTKTIAFLRSLLSPSNWQPTDTATPFSVTGVITTTTNLTSGTTSSYYIQDSTDGINLFITGDATFRPVRGDLVTAIGTLSSFNNSLELAVNASNPYQTYSILSHNNVVPAPFVFGPTLTNNPTMMETFVEGRFLMMTNVFFPTAGTAVFPSGANVVVTNQSGVPFVVFVSSQCTNVVGQTMPSFAWGVRGAMAQFVSGTTYSSNGYELNLTDMSDLITNPPSATTPNVAMVGGHTALTWTAVPYDYSYSVLTSTNVTGPYAPETVYVALLSATNEVPTNSSTATGYGTVQVSPDQSTITVNLSFSGLTGNATAAHIHGPAGAGTNGSVLFPFSGVPSATSGSIPQQSFSITPTQLGYLQNGLLYMNVHTALNGGGEIRGQLFLVPSQGLTFTTSSGTYTDPLLPPGPKFYKLSSP